MEQDLILLERVPLAQNMADHFTKCLLRVLFYRHNDYIMGRVVPPHLPLFRPGYTPQAPAAAAAKLIFLEDRSLSPWELYMFANELFYNNCLEDLVVLASFFFAISYSPI